jgi:hypothetical protein
LFYFVYVSVSSFFWTKMIEGKFHAFALKYVSVSFSQLNNWATNSPSSEKYLKTFLFNLYLCDLSHSFVVYL